MSKKALNTIKFLCALPIKKIGGVWAQAACIVAELAAGSGLIDKAIAAGKAEKAKKTDQEIKAELKEQAHNNGGSPI